MKSSRALLRLLIVALSPPHLIMESALEASSLGGVNKLLAAIEFSPPPFILFLTGSSGCGKTFL